MNQPNPCKAKLHGCPSECVATSGASCRLGCFNTNPAPEITDPHFLDFLHTNPLPGESGKQPQAPQPRRWPEWSDDKLREMATAEDGCMVGVGSADAVMEQIFGKPQPSQRPTMAEKESKHWILYFSEGGESGIAVPSHRILREIHDAQCMCKSFPEDCDSEGVRETCFDAAQHLIAEGRWSVDFEDGWIRVESIREAEDVAAQLSAALEREKAYLEAQGVAFSTALLLTIAQEPRLLGAQESFGAKPTTDGDV